MFESIIMALGVGQVIETPTYVLAIFGAVAATVKWLRHKQHIHESLIIKENKDYIDLEILRIERAHIEYDSVFHDMDKSILRIESKINLLDTVQNDIAILKTSMEFLKQMMWGRDVKSDAPYLSDTEETQFHKDEEESGIFYPTEEEREERDRGHTSTQDNSN